MDYKFNFHVETFHKVIRKISQIDYYKGKWEPIYKKESRYQRKLRQEAMISRVGASLRLEHGAYSDNEIAALLGRTNIADLPEEEDRLVMGYKEAVELVFRYYEEMALDQQQISALHSMMYKYSRAKPLEAEGMVSKKIVVTYEGSDQEMGFTAPRSFQVVREMAELMQWFQHAWEDQYLHPLLLTAAFAYEWLSIDPFEKGNLPLGNLLTNLCLLQSGYSFIHYVAFEPMMENRMLEFRQALGAAQQYRGTDREVIDEWVLYFLQTLELSLKQLEHLQATGKDKGSYLNDRQKQILEYIRLHQPIKIGDIHHYFGSISRNTIKKDLQYFLAEELLEKIGHRKGTVYVTRDEAESSLFI
ncbi:MAG: DeoR family transcriptional regulator [Bacteroidetes bacterium]|nr:MAG: DeoR family transcriptional regulator [Bacteroidota bacterium]